jgi:hypothetical protein
VPSRSAPGPRPATPGGAKYRRAHHPRRGLLAAGCEEKQPLSPALESAAAPVRYEASVPAPLVPVAYVGGALRIWPYVGTDFSGTPQDPVNLVFFGVGDPRNVRDALRSVDGARAGPLAGFDCRWTDAFGSQETSYSEQSEWSGSVIQLECGSYDPFRIHLRLFPAGGGTVGNAHFDLLIPGTTDHQVLSWEFGEQFVTYDLARSGYLSAPPGQSGPINAVGTFREIPPVIYDGLPPQLRALTGGPLSGAVTAPVGIPTDGSATLLALADAPQAGGTEQDIVIHFAQTIPKPFCNGGGDFVRVDGPVRLRQRVDVSRSGVLTSQRFADGDLVVRSVDPTTGQLGAPVEAHVREHYGATLGDHVASVRSMRSQQLLVANGPPQRFLEQLQVGPNGLTRYLRSERCGS